LQRIGVVYWDAIKIAGGTKCLASPDRESDRDYQRYYEYWTGLGDEYAGAAGAGRR